MKNVLYIIFGILLMVNLNGCFSDESNTATSKLWIYSEDDDEMEQRGFNKVKTSKYSSIWVESGMPVSENALLEITTFFDETVYPNITTKFASNYDFDEDGKVALVIYKGSTSDSFVAGYFNPADFYDNYSDSNKWDALYLNGINSSHLPGSENFNNTVAHEFQHLCNFSENVMKENRGDYTYSMFTWIDEGMSENAAAICAGIESQYSRLEHYAEYDDEIRNGKRSVTIWEDDLDNYDLVYMFFGYLRGRFGDDVFKDIISNSDNGFGAVDEALSTGDGFNEVFESFVSDLRKKNNFPDNFFPEDFSVPLANTSADIRPYTFVYSNNFTSINSALVYYNNVANTTTTANEAVAALYLDTDKNTWRAENSSLKSEDFAISTKLLPDVALRNSRKAKESGKTDIVFSPRDFQ